MHTRLNVCGFERVVLLIEHATRMRHIVICGPSGFPRCFDIVSYTARFSEKR